MNTLKKLWMRLFHRHSYEMVFEGDELNFKLICRCGDIAADFTEALAKMENVVKENERKNYELLRMGEGTPTLVPGDDIPSDHLGRKDG